MSSLPTVRGIRQEEHGALGALTVAAYRELLGDDVDGDYLIELADVAGRAGPGQVLVAVDAQERLLGGVTYLPGAGPLAPHAQTDEAVIRYLAVAQETRGRGAGAALVAACVERARTEGKARLSLHTTAPMTTAQRLYERSGFRRDPDHDQVVGTGLMLLAYMLDLRR